MTGALAMALVFLAAGAVALSVPVVRERLSSMRTGVGLLAVVAVLAILGVLIGQDLPTEAYTERFGRGAGALIVGSGLSSVFRTWYFLGAVWALMLSVACCSFRRILRLVRSGAPRLRRLRAVGSLITHLSLIAVVAGGVLTGALGFRRPDARFLAAGDTTEVPEGGFSLEVLEARTEFNDAGQLSDYVSVVRVTEDARDAGTHRIEVNHPLTVNGVGVYQFEMMPSPYSVEAILLSVALNLPGGPGGPFELVVPFDEETDIPGSGLTVKALEFLSDFTYDVDSGTAELRSVWHNNPAVLVRVSATGQAVFERWLFIGMQAHADEEDLPCRLRFLDYEPDFRNGLTRFEYSRQPGTPLLFWGLGALSIGMCLVLWTGMSRREAD